METEKTPRDYGIEPAFLEDLVAKTSFLEDLVTKTNNLKAIDVGNALCSLRGVKGALPWGALRSFATPFFLLFLCSLT